MAGILLAIAAVRLPPPGGGSRFAWGWLFGGGAEGARGVLTAIAGSLITVTATIFSVTIVALQLASSQFTPRLLRSFVADRVNQAVLGTFIGTFTYTLLVLRTIQAGTDGGRAFVPQVGVSIAIVLLLVSIAALIIFIDHAAQSIRASVILHRESQRTLALVDQLFPAPGTTPRPIPLDASDAALDALGSPAVVAATRAGYLQAVDTEALWRLGAEGDTRRVTIRMELRVGAFALPGRRLASVWPAEAVDDEAVAAIRAALFFGTERAPDRDLELGIVELSDIAVRALSPGINDPTTAMHCIDRLAQVLAALGSRPPADDRHAGPDGRVTIISQGTSFARATGLAFDQLSHFGAGNPSIIKKLLESLGDLTLVVTDHARPALHECAAAVLRAARRDIADPVDLAAIERLADDLITSRAAHVSSASS